MAVVIGTSSSSNSAYICRRTNWIMHLEIFREILIHPNSENIYRILRFLSSRRSPYRIGRWTIWTFQFNFAFAHSHVHSRSSSPKTGGAIYDRLVDINSVYSPIPTCIVNSWCMRMANGGWNSASDIVYHQQEQQQRNRIHFISTELHRKALWCSSSETSIQFQKHTTHAVCHNKRGSNQKCILSIKCGDVWAHSSPHILVYQRGKLQFVVRCVACKSRIATRES